MGGINIKNNIFLITGASGSGKTSIAHELKRKNYWHECISHTSRPIREGEKDGETYYFTTKEQMKEMFANGEFAEFVEYNGNFYGVSKNEINKVMNLGVDVFIIVEYKGYKQIKEIYPNAIGIFINTSKEDCLANMLIRGDKLEDALKRISTYDKEVENISEYDYVIKNVRDRFTYTCDIVKDIILQNKFYKF